MLHFFMTICGTKPELEFQAELFLRSLDLFGKVGYYFTICQGPADRLTNPYLKRKAEVIINHNPLGLEPSWYGSLGCVPLKGDVTIYTDADILVSGALHYIVNQCRKTKSVCGVIAYASPFEDQSDWRKLFSGCDVPWPEKSYIHSRETTKHCPFYPNLGFVAVPTEFVPLLNEALPHFLFTTDKVFPKHYHRPQLAMCLAVASLRLPQTSLPLWCNYPDLYNDLPVDERAVVIHLLKGKSVFHNWKELRAFLKRPAYNEVGKMVQNKMHRISGLLSL